MFIDQLFSLLGDNLASIVFDFIWGMFGSIPVLGDIVELLFS